MKIRIPEELTALISDVMIDSSFISVSFCTLNNTRGNFDKYIISIQYSNREEQFSLGKERNQKQTYIKNYKKILDIIEEKLNNNGNLI